jgi:hypothetical protein
MHLQLEKKQLWRADTIAKEHVRQGSMKYKLIAVPPKLTFAVASERHSS